MSTIVGRLQREQLHSHLIIADLINTAGSDGEAEYVVGYSAKDDAGDPWEMRYHESGRPVADGGFAVDGPGTDDWWEAVDKSSAYVRRFGAKGDGTTNDTATVNQALSAAKAVGSVVRFSAGNYVGTFSVSNADGLEIEGDRATVLHPVEGDTGRVTLSYCLRVSNSAGVSVKDLRFSGQHLNSLGGDNFQQGGINFVACTDSVATSCVMDAFQRGFVLNTNSSGCSVVDSKVRDSFVGFFALNAPATSFLHCKAEDCRFASHRPTGLHPGEARAAGQGFLVENSSGSTVGECSSIRSGSDCFRVQGSDNVGISNCISNSTRRIGLSFRTVKASTVSGFRVVNPGDSSFWTGGVDSFESADPSPDAVLLEGAVDVVLDSVLVHGPLTETVCGNGFFVGQAEPCEDVKILNSTVSIGCSNSGVFVTLANRLTVVNTKSEIQVLTAGSGSYPFEISGSGNGHVFRNNQAVNGNDGYTTTAPNGRYEGNVAIDSFRHGYHAIGAGNTFVANRAENVGSQEMRAFGLTRQVANDWQFKAAPPTTNTWNVGDRVENTATVAGGNAGWVCIVGGLPGTWKTYGQIEP